MRVRFRCPVLGLLLLLTATLPGFGKDYNLATLEEAHRLFRSATDATMYAEAAHQYEYLVEEEGIRNGKLFYTLGNSWFMAGDVGRAILNYRRAQLYSPNNADLQHNLQAALALRTDLIPEKPPHPLAAQLLGWHFHTSPSLRWWLFAPCWGTFWGACFWRQRSVRREARILVIAAGLLSAGLLTSLITESIQKKNAQPGVILAQEVLTRKGDGDMYAPAFREPLHSGTEFQRLEARTQWWQIRLPDGQTCWIPANTAEAVALD